MKKEKWYLKNSSTIIRVDDIKEFTDLFVNHLEQFTQQMKEKILLQQQAQIQKTPYNHKPIFIVIPDEEFFVLEKKIKTKLTNKKVNLRGFAVSTSMVHNKIDVVIMNQTHLDELKRKEEEKKNLLIEQEIVTEEIVEDQK